MLSLQASTQRALDQACVDFFALVNIIPRQGPALLLCSASYPGTHVDAVENIDDISPIELAVDPITRKTQLASVEIRCIDDGYLRDASQLSPLKSSRVVIRYVHGYGLGTVRCWEGRVHDVVPRDGFVTVRCGDLLDLAAELQFYGLLAGKHPLEGLDLLLDVAGISDENRDSDALDPNTDTGISHLVLSGIESLVDDDQMRIDTTTGLYAPPPLHPSPAPGVPGTGLGQNEKGLAGTVAGLIDQLAQHCGGGVWMNEDGRVTFQRYVRPTEADATWDQYDLLSYEVAQVFEGLINEVHCHFGTGEMAATWTYRDRQSQTDVAPLDDGDRRAVLELSFPFDGARMRVHKTAVLDHDDVGPSETDFLVWGFGAIGCSGARVYPPLFHGRLVGTDWADVEPFLQQDESKVNPSAGRYLYLQAGSEVMRVKALEIFEGAAPQLEFRDLDARGNQTGTMSFFPWKLRITDVDRGFGGTTARTLPAPGGVKLPLSAQKTIMDITAARMVAEVIVDRCRHGLPKLRVSTTVAKIAHQIGDVIKIDGAGKSGGDDLEFFWWGVDGLGDDNPILWEITRKSVRLLDGVIDWELTYASVETEQSEPDPVDEPALDDTEYESPGGVLDRWTIDGNQDETIEPCHIAGTTTFNVLWDEEVATANGTMDTSTGVWTCKRAGVYRIKTSVVLNPGDPSSGRLRVNGADVVLGPFNGTFMVIDTTGPLDVDDEVTVAIVAACGTTPATVVDSDSATFLEITYMGAAP